MNIQEDPQRSIKVFTKNLTVLGFYIDMSLFSKTGFGIFSLLSIFTKLKGMHFEISKKKIIDFLVELGLFTVVLPSTEHCCTWELTLFSFHLETSHIQVSSIFVFLLIIAF
jgi:hypothetical protein